MTFQKYLKLKRIKIDYPRYKPVCIAHEVWNWEKIVSDVELRLI